MSFAWSDRRRGRGWLIAAVLAYGLVVALTPLLHHDLECHWRTPRHCVACFAAPVALGAQAGAACASPLLTDVGGVAHPATRAPEHALTAGTHGRSPPL
jgi:hypothetical protein